MKNQENNFKEVIAREIEESGAGIEEEIRQDPEISQMEAGDGFKERFYEDCCLRILRRKTEKHFFWDGNCWKRDLSKRRKTFLYVLVSLRLRLL